MDIIIKVCKNCKIINELKTNVFYYINKALFSLINSSEYLILYDPNKNKFYYITEAQIQEILNANNI